MLSINTNISSLITQTSMKQSTNSLNQAIERMTTGFKINHAKDNAANYSISTNMTTKLGAYQVAQDNVSIGMEMVGTAESVIFQMHDHAIRLRELATQARNNTYGAQSLQAIQSEADAIIAEIARLYSSSEFNGISLFETNAAAGANPIATFATPRAVTSEPTFISNPKTYDDATVEAMNSINTFTSGASGEFKIEDAENLAYLATIVNDNGWDTSNATFVLADNIDLTSWNATNGNWVPIGNNSRKFKGTFDGNGHVISNLTIDNTSADYQGLFAHTSNLSIIKNVGLEDGSVKGKEYVGMLVGNSKGSITNCYAIGDVTGAGNFVGGLAGYTTIKAITSSYAMVDVTGAGNYVGGLAGYVNSPITNCYATGDVTGAGNFVGGLVGNVDMTDITDSYATGDVTGAGNFVGGLMGYGSDSTTTNCGAVQADDYATLMTKEEILAIVRPTPAPPAGGTGGGTNTGGIGLQVGIHDDLNSRISFNTYFQYDLFEVGADIGTDASLSAIDNFINVLSAKETELGAVTNRLESVLDEIEIQYNNLVSSRSTIRDADIAEASSHYIQQQILQQASATLLATANQSPAIALQLI